MLPKSFEEKSFELARENRDTEFAQWPAKGALRLSQAGTRGRAWQSAQARVLLLSHNPRRVAGGKAAHRLQKRAFYGEGDDLSQVKITLHCNKVRHAPIHAAYNAHAVHLHAANFILRESIPQHDLPAACAMDVRSSGVAYVVLAQMIRTRVTQVQTTSRLLAGSAQKL